jgi:3-phosphoshikimate 1-carboxyvinyltransferase
VVTDGTLQPGAMRLDARLSGTTARFLLPLLALGRGSYTLDGRPPLRARPIGATIDALRRLGAEIEELCAPGHLPLTVHGRGLVGGATEVDGAASSQFLSGLLLSGPAMAAGLTVQLQGELVSRPFLDITQAVMRRFGAEVSKPDDRTYAVAPVRYSASEIAVEPDASAASYFFAAAAICGGRVRVEGIGTESVQGDVGFVDVLERMGASVERTATSVEVRGGALNGIEVDLSDLPDMAQTLAAVAVFADGPTTARGIGFIRGHETDRLAAVVTELRRCGVKADEHDDGFTIHPATPHAAVVETYDDHRMAMSFALLGLRVPGIAIADPECVSKTFPGFFAALDQLR